MRNPYLENLSKIEFVITNACTGRCKHCSEGDHSASGERIDPAIAADSVRRIASEYDITTVMTFGGEPLLYPDAVYAVMNAAAELGIPKRQVITHGYFSQSQDKISDVAKRLFECKVSDLCISVDAFHQEYIPLDTVKLFAAEAKRLGIPIRLQPAWLVSREDKNQYNLKTQAILDSFFDLDVPIGDGNVIFPEGNAAKYLGEYFTDTTPENPYIENENDVRCISFSANGDVLNGNVYRQDIVDIVNNYTPL